VSIEGGILPATRARVNAQWAMNYRHIYHAGNFADVAKHVGLVYCLDAMKRKDAAFFVLDTHAGRGYYDLRGAEAQKSGEAERGIQRLLHSAGTGEPLAAYLQALGAPPGERMARYPGSPALIAAALRPQDRAVCNELMPAEARALTREIYSSGRLRIEVGDGYAALRSHLPPAERRGLVLIDPPYESAAELESLTTALADAHGRWPTGTFVVWYPIVSAAQRRRVHARFTALALPKMLLADLAVHPDDASVGLAGSGLLLVNPPYGADEYLRAAYGAIHASLAEARRGYVEVTRLTAERMAQ
jgi:23S rRNA (adenine2030-N6)-methyltransferase